MEVSGDRRKTPLDHHRPPFSSRITDSQTETNTKAMKSTKKALEGFSFLAIGDRR